MFTRFSNFQHIDCGSFGVVRKAYDTKLNKNVAIKTLYREHKYAIENELRAHQLASSLNNAHIIPLYDVCSEEDRVSLVMELSDFGSLKCHENISRSDIIHVAQNMLDALSEIHKANILHGDVKPANILCFDNNVYKICDFGHSQLNFTRSGLEQGTPLFIAPEMFYKEYGLATDMWALGITLYMLHHNCHPFYNNNEYPTKHLFSKLYHQSQIQFADNLDKRLQYLITMCLKPEEKDRISAKSALEIFYE